MPRVQNLFRAPKKHLPMEDLSEVRAVGDTGFEGCAHARGGLAGLEVSAVCTPCDQMDAIRPGLQKELWRRRGMLCRVLEGGVIRRGDPIEKLS